MMFVLPERTCGLQQARQGADVDQFELESSESHTGFMVCLLAFEQALGKILLQRCVRKPQARPLKQLHVVLM